MFNDALKYRKSLWPADGGCSSSDGRITGQFPSDLFHGRADTLGHAAIAKLGGPILARLVVVSNWVSVPNGDGAKRAGGLEVALRPATERNGGVWFRVERQGRSTLRRRDAHELSPVERRLAGPQRTTVAPILYGGQLSPPPCSLASEDYSQPAAADLARQCISPNARDGQFQSVGVGIF